ncbi:MAG: hypothetical protein ACR2GC_03310 [Methyloceanibacter sp.]|uniref:hypothetical protein n=1 Tax=Methyloceanibacter sp. TaxID=1965321 RepID=UPI003D9AFB03
MRIFALIALASCGVLGLSFSADAQTGTSPVAPTRTLSVPKQSTPQLLAPPQLEPVPAAPTPARETRSDPLPTVVVPQPVEMVEPHPMRDYAPVVQEAAPGPPSASLAPHAFSTPDRLLDWMSNYRKHPRPSLVPAAVHAMFEFGLFSEEEKQWFCIGFIAGVLGNNPKDGPKLIAQMFPMPDKEQAVIIRAIAYSGRPDWRELLEKNSSRMPLRRPLIDDFLNGKRPILMQLPLDTGGSPGIYALWGYYVATGQHQPVLRIMDALRWSKNKSDSGFSWRKIFSGWGNDPSAVEKITTGGTAKWTLASYAERDRELLALYRAEQASQPEEIAKPLEDVIEAAEAFESEKIRKDQFGAIEDAQRQKMTSDVTGTTKGVTAGSIAIATGCVAATALGQAQIAIPCVIGGALYTGAAKLAH